jgi:glycerophosphoryl diester phosphodiesterase
MTRNTTQHQLRALGGPAVPAGLCLLLLTLFITSSSLAAQPDSAPVPTAPAAPSRTLIIAHRGASAHLPEHTLASYALAYGMGADAIEPDLVMTKDDVLICAHDLTIPNAAAMEATFDGSRRRADGKWYYIDFTLDELRSVQATLGRDAGAASDGGATAPSGFSVTTLSEMALLVQRLNRTTGRGVAIVPEPKSAKFHTQAGKDIAAALIRDLAALGYTKRTDACVIQSFELETLRRMRAELKCDLPLVYLFGDPVAPAVLDDVATFADGKWYYIDFTLDELRSVQAALGRDAAAEPGQPAAAEPGAAAAVAHPRRAARRGRCARDDGRQRRRLERVVWAARGL